MRDALFSFYVSIIYAYKPTKVLKYNEKTVKRRYTMSVFSEKEKVDILSDVVKIKSENDNEKEICVYLKKLLSQYDIDSNILEINDTRANLVAEIGNGFPILAISGHMDVVASGDKSKWTYPPFELTEKDDKLYGRVTTDMKGGLVALVLALIELKEENKLNQGTIRLLATSGEEKEQKGALLFNKQGYLDDVDGLIIGEPTNNVVYYAHKGSMSCQVTAKGKTAHSSMPQLGVNAIDILIDFINEMRLEYKHIKNNDKKHQLDVVPMMEKNLDKDIDDDEKHIFSGFTMLNSIINSGEQFNSVPEKATVEYNVRTVPEYDNVFVKDLFEKVIQRVEKNKLELTIPSNHHPVLSDKDNDLIQCISNIASKYVDDDFVISALIGTTDASSLLGENKDNVDLAIFGPGDSLVAHQIDEFIYKNMYLNYIDIYKDVFVDYLDSKSK